jgi:uncharacterized damage-inducible protein DinB
MNNVTKLLLGFMCHALLASAQAPSQQSANPLATVQMSVFSLVKTYLIRSAEEMPEANYNFKPAPEVRSFGQILAHVADSQFVGCSGILGEANPSFGVEKTKTSKADITQALQASFAYCEKAFGGLTDANAAALVSYYGSKAPKLSALSGTTTHNMEHYGNLVTYLRIKGLVPPSSEPRQ